MAKNNLVTQQGVPVNNAAENLGKSTPLTHAELDNNFFSIYVATNGTAEESKALIVDASKNIAGIASLTATTLTDGTATITGGDISAVGVACHYASVIDSKATNTAAASGSSGAWTKREIAENVDVDGIMTVASNTIVLDAGTYDCRITSSSSSLAGTERHMLYNVTAGTTLILGVNNSSDGNSSSVISGRFTVAGSQTLEIRTYQGIGVAFGAKQNIAGINEVYLIGEFWKVSS